jgi:Protein of unknown function (DUF1097)
MSTVESLKIVQTFPILNRGEQERGDAGGHDKHGSDASAILPLIATGEGNMNIITALAIVIGALAAVATWLCLGTPLGLQVWALFIGWGSFFHTGGKEAGLKNSSIAHVWGALVATIALIIIGNVAGSVIVTSLIVGISVVALVMGAHMPLLASIPAAVYGYAATAALTLLTGVALADTGAMIKAAAIVVASLIVGNVFGYVSEKIAGSLAKT